MKLSDTNLIPKFLPVNSNSIFIWRNHIVKKVHLCVIEELASKGEAPGKILDLKFEVRKNISSFIRNFRHNEII